MNCETFLDNALRGVAGFASPHINVGDINAFEISLKCYRIFSSFHLFNFSTHRDYSLTIMVS